MLILVDPKTNEVVNIEDEMKKEKAPAESEPSETAAPAVKKEVKEDSDGESVRAEFTRKITQAAVGAEDKVKKSSAVDEQPPAPPSSAPPPSIVVPPYVPPPKAASMEPSVPLDTPSITTANQMDTLTPERFQTPETPAFTPPSDAEKRQQQEENEKLVHLENQFQDLYAEKEPEIESMNYTIDVLMMIREIVKVFLGRFQRDSFNVFSATKRLRSLIL
jgi:hypothetical protein